MNNEEKLRSALVVAKMQLALLKSTIVCKEPFNDDDGKRHDKVMKHIMEVLEETHKPNGKIQSRMGDRLSP